MSEHDCPLSPAQRAAYRDWQVREILSRREAAGQLSTLRVAVAVAVAVATMRPPDDRAKATARRECPLCGKPYGRRVRCYDCSPGGTFGKGSR